MAAHVKRQLTQTLRALARARLAFADLRAYILSDKFHEWPYVNIEDIAARCVNARSEIDFAETRCALCDLAEANDNHICADCAAAIEYGKNARNDERQVA